MGTFDGPFRSLAKTLVGLPGAKATIRVASTQSYDPLTDQKTVTNTQHTVNTSQPSPYKSSQIDGTSILQGDVHVLIAALDLEAAGLSDLSIEEHTVEINGTRFRIVDFNRLYSGEKVAAFDVS